MSSKITIAESQTLFNNDIAVIEGRVKNAISVPLYQHEYDALVSLAFNMGSLSKAPSLCRKLNSGDYTGAPVEFLDIENQRLQYNTVVSAAMKMLNALDSAKGAQPAVLRETYGVMLRVLYPVVPHLTFQLWQELGYADEFGSLLDAPWPKVDEKALEQSEIELVLQVNGKVRGALTVSKDASRESIEQLAAAHEMVAKFSEGKAPKKIVVVPGRLVNVVV